jgi:murein DD-endopeptidase MepM/ murein hydrolase activator NlpD
MAIERRSEGPRFLIGAGALLIIVSMTSLQLAWRGGVLDATKTTAAQVSHFVTPRTGSTTTGVVLRWPISHARLTQAFGPTANTSEPAFGGHLHFHPGVDLAVDAGTPVMAAADGTVTVALDRLGKGNGYGDYVVLRHPDGTETVYAHLEAVLVSTSRQVKAGQVIGLVGSTGNSSGPHLHFEYWVNGVPVDPLPHLPEDRSRVEPA